MTTFLAKAVANFPRLASPRKLQTPKAGNLNMGAQVQQFNDFFVTLYLRRKNPEQERWLAETGQNDRLAIIIQGPIISEEDYTLRTAEAYRAWFPASPIIYSTWDDQDAADLEAIRELGCHLNVSKSDLFPAPRNDAERAQVNVNKQMHSSHAGLLVAQGLGSEFALKTRSDQRICNPQAVRALPGLMGVFGLPPGTNQLGRIVVSSLNTFALRMYGVSDMFTFGFLKDLIDYWDGTQDRRSTVSSEGSLRQYANQRIGEVFFTSNFLERKGDVLEWTLEHYWSELSRRFLVVDSSFLDQHWPKYTEVENRWAWRDDPKFAEVTFAMWFAMKEGRMQPNESLLDIL